MYVQDHPATVVIAKDSKISQSSSPPLEVPDDIASGLSSDEDTPSTAEGPAAETAVLIAQTPALEHQPDHVYPHLPSIMARFFKCCIGNKLWHKMEVCQHAHQTRCVFHITMAPFSSLASKVCVDLMWCSPGTSIATYCSWLTESILPVTGARQRKDQRGPT